MVAAQALGIARAAFEFACDYASERQAFGDAIIENQGVSFPLADVATQLDAARLLTWRAAWMAAQGVPFHQAEGSMSKLAASEVAVRATERAVQACGGWGYIKDLPVEKWYRDAKLYTIFEGTSEIQRLVIGRTLADAGICPRGRGDSRPLGAGPCAGAAGARHAGAAVAPTQQGRGRAEQDRPQALVDPQRLVGLRAHVELVEPELRRVVLLAPALEDVIGALVGED